MAEIIPKPTLLNSSSVRSSSLRKQQILAVRELNRDYTHILEILLENRLYAERILKVLVAHAFSYQAEGVYQYIPAGIVKHIRSS